MNQFSATVVQADDISDTYLLNWNGNILTASDPCWQTRDNVQCTIDPRNIFISKNLSGILGIENRIPAVVLNTTSDSKTTRYKTIVNGAVLYTQLTKQLADEINIKAGDQVELLFRSQHIELKNPFTRQEVQTENQRFKMEG